MTEENEKRIPRSQLEFTDAEHELVKGIIRQLPLRDVPVKEIYSKIIVQICKQDKAPKKIIELLSQGETKESKWRFPFV